MDYEEHTKEMDESIEELWDGMTDVPFDEKGDGEMYIAQDYKFFRKGTPRTEIWHWFDERHSKGIHYLLYERGGGNE